jgi:hypothetical protein
LSAVAFASIEVIDLVGSTLYSADSLVNIVELSSWALSAEVVDQVVSWFAHTSVLDPIFVHCAGWAAYSVTSLATGFFVAIDAVAALVLLVVYLGLGITDAAHSTYEVIAG